MKVDLMYSVHYIPHPWDKKANQAGMFVYALCREVRLPVEVGSVRGKQISWEPVALFNHDSEGRFFDEFCLAEVPTDVIEPSQQLLEVKGVKLPRRTA